MTSINIFFYIFPENSFIFSMHKITYYKDYDYYYYFIIIIIIDDGKFILEVVNH